MEPHIRRYYSRKNTTSHLRCRCPNVLTSSNPRGKV